MAIGAGVVNQRAAVFISHANPEDNRFTIWLGAKLASMGYEVWADVMRLRGGDDWQRKLENALRVRALKVLLVANPVSVEKQGVRNEVQIASEVAKEINDHEFIIPLRLAKFKSPFLIAHAQYIDFSASWSRGLADLIEALDSYQIPRASSAGTDIWREIQLIHAKKLVDEPEILMSNWLGIAQLPAVVRIYDFSGGIPIGESKRLMSNAVWPLVEHKRGFISFAPIHDLQHHFGPALPLILVGEKPTRMFLEAGWVEHDIEPWTARNHFGDLTRQAIEEFLRSRNLPQFELANGHLAWWASSRAAPKSKISFKWGEVSGLRQIQGHSEKRRMHWHYGVSMNARVVPILHIRIVGRLIFTSDGSSPFDPARMHRLRRSFAKAWRNARWRDMLLAFIWWLADGKAELVVPTSTDEGIAIRLPPLSFRSPVSLCFDGTEPLDDDDDPTDDEDPDIFEDADSEDASEAEDDQ